nr:TIGR03086 family metal-binding protein [Kineosporia babensis]
MIPLAIERFGARVHGVRDGQWDDKSTCTEWTVRELTNHLVGEHLWAPHLLARETLENVGTRYDGDLVGADPSGAWDAAAAGSAQAWSGADLAGRAQFSFGEAPLSEYATQMLLDLTVHQWDLARSTGQDEALDPEAVAVSLEYARTNVEKWRDFGITAAPVPTDSTDLAVQLICLTGRQV